jgi:hypothetical protein
MQLVNIGLIIILKPLMRNSSFKTGLQKAAEDGNVVIMFKMNGSLRCLEEL